MGDSGENSPLCHILNHILDPLVLRGWGEMNFNYFTRSGKFENLKKGVGSMVEEQVFLKGDWPLSYLVFARLIIFAFKNCFTLCKIVLYI